MRSLFYYLLPVVMLVLSCQKQTDRPLQIAVTKSSESYQNWLLSVDSTLEIVNLYGLTVDSAIIVLQNCDGLLVTGGDDVFAGYYAQLSDTVLCEGFDHYRDSLEMAAIKLAKSRLMPIFGVCRGLQIVNVEAGGSLIPDLPARHPSDVSHRCDDWVHCFHNVTIDTMSQLFVMMGSRRGTVNTNHHQAIDRLGAGLKATAMASDGVVEAIEAVPNVYGGFLVAVQWHPERLSENPNFSVPLARHFLEAAILYHNRPQ